MNNIRRKCLLSWQVPSTGSVAGVDYSQEMVEQATARNAKEIAAGIVQLHYGSVSIPTLRLGPLFAYLSTIASMIAFVNNVVAGAGITILASNLLDRDRAWLAPPIHTIANFLQPQIHNIN